MALFEEENENIESRRQEFIKKQEQEIKDVETQIENINKDNKKKKKIKNLKIKKLYLYLSIPFILLPGYFFMGFNTFHVTPFVIDKDKYFKTWKTDIDYLGNKNETIKYENSFLEKNKLYYSSGWYQREDGRYENVARDLRESAGRVQIFVELKIKNGVPVDFKIDLVKLASTIGNKDIENLELCGWGFFDSPIEY